MLNQRVTCLKLKFMLNQKVTCLKLKFMLNQRVTCLKFGVKNVGMFFFSFEIFFWLSSYSEQISRI